MGCPAGETSPGEEGRAGVLWVTCFAGRLFFLHAKNAQVQILLEIHPRSLCPFGPARRAGNGNQTFSLIHLAGGFTPSTLLRASPAQDHQAAAHGAALLSTAFLGEAGDGKLPADLSALAQGCSGFFLTRWFHRGRWRGSRALTGLLRPLSTNHPWDAIPGKPGSPRWVMPWPGAALLTQAHRDLPSSSSHSRLGGAGRCGVGLPLGPPGFPRLSKAQQYRCSRNLAVSFFFPFS